MHGVRSLRSPFSDQARSVKGEDRPAKGLQCPAGRAWRGPCSRCVVSECF